MNLYADDTLFYRVISSSNDYVELQNDINTFTKWVDKNRLTLNAKKYKYMVISKLKSRALPLQAVTLFNQSMLRVSTYKYLGVIISDDLSWALHIEEITSKARKLVGMLYRNFYRWSRSDALLKLYLSLIRPHLENAVQVWNPYLIKDIQKLETVQKFALRMCLKRYLDGVLATENCLVKVISLDSLTEGSFFA